MTPQEYIETEQRLQSKINDLEHQIADARELADKCPLPSNRRPAEPDDIKSGAVIWYEEWASRGDGTAGWCIVDEPRHYGDPFKAFIADDGCRYGLEGASVEVPTAEK